MIPRKSQDRKFARQMLEIKVIKQENPVFHCRTKFYHLGKNNLVRKKTLEKESFLKDDKSNTFLGTKCPSCYLFVWFRMPNLQVYGFIHSFQQIFTNFTAFPGLVASSTG